MEYFELTISSPNILISISGKTIRTPLKAKVSKEELARIIHALKSQRISNFQYISLRDGAIYKGDDLPTIGQLLVEPQKEEFPFSALRKIKIESDNDNQETIQKNTPTNYKANVSYTDIENVKIIELKSLSDKALEEISKKIF